MYLWKCWREYRHINLLLLSLAVIITWIVDYATIALPRIENGVQRTGFSAHDMPTFGQVHAVLVILMGVFAGCIVSAGGGLGREYDNRTPEFLYSRPVRRSEVLWTNWACGLLSMLGVMAVPIMAYFGLCLLYAHKLGTLMIFQTVPWMLPISLMLFGLAQFFGVLLEGAPKGAAFACAAVGLYLFAAWAAARYDLRIPDWMHYYGFPNATPGHWLNCLIWLMIALAFPIATLKLLERRDL